MDNLQIVQDVYKNFGERNVPGVLAHFDKNVRLDETRCT